MSDMKMYQTRKTELTGQFDAVHAMHVKRGAELREVNAEIEHLTVDAMPEHVAALLSQREALKLIIAAGDRQLRKLQEQLDAIQPIILDFVKRRAQAEHRVKELEQAGHANAAEITEAQRALEALQ